MSRPRYFCWVQVDEAGNDLKPEPNKATITVYEQDAAVVRTGLLDANGYPLMKEVRPPMVGFIRFEAAD